MRNSIFDYIDNLDTLLAVIVGACLATGGALIAEIIQDRLSRRRRQRDAARFFGELVASLAQLFDLALASRTSGDPWGSYTVRLFDVARVEADTYIRNRERLFDIEDMDLRFAVHEHILRFSMPIADLVDRSEKITEMVERLEEQGDSLSDQARQAIEARIERLSRYRDGGFSIASEERTKTTG
ncbi:MAG: hypothetical protein AAFO63_09675, partial [Pseudomonadota bacterium]